MSDNPFVAVLAEELGRHVEPEESLKVLQDFCRGIELSTGGSVESTLQRGPAIGYGQEWRVVMWTAGSDAPQLLLRAYIPQDGWPVVVDATGEQLARFATKAELEQGLQNFLRDPDVVAQIRFAAVRPPSPFYDTAGTLGPAQGRLAGFETQRGRFANAVSDSPTAPSVRHAAPETHSTRTGVHFAVPLECGPHSSLGPPYVPPEDSVPAQPRESVSDTLLERVRIDRNYADRPGYHAEFLGRGLHVPLPRLDAALEAQVSRLQEMAEVPGPDAYTLKYEHFSVVQHRRRKLALLTAVNIDGARRFNLGEREGDAWSKDPRIDPDHQVGEELYAGSDLDRGHLVRRLDPVWGANPQEATRANDDTFHFTNCAPQHARFNRGKRLWQGVENFVLNRALAEGFRLCVLTGPVFQRDDPEFRGVQLPLAYWKIMVFARRDGSLSASAYLLSQEGLIQDMLREARRPAFDPSLFQVPVARISAETGIDFSYLSAHDPLEIAGGEREIVRPGEAAAPAERRIRRFADLVL